MSKEFLLEIYTEELPTFAQNKEEYRAFYKNILAKHNLQYNDTIKIFTTPRRVTLYLPQLEDTVIIPDKRVKGPKIDNTEAVAKFCLKHKITPDQLTEEKGYYIYIEKTEPKSTHELLEKILPLELHTYKFPKSMKWNSSNISWVRPIRSILAIYNQAVVKFTFAGIESSNTTFFNRYISHVEYDYISSFEQYTNILKHNSVILCEYRRKEQIKSEIENILQNKIHFADSEERIDSFARLAAMYSEFPHLSFAEINIPNLPDNNALWNKLVENVMEGEILLQCGMHFIFISNVPTTTEISNDYLNLVKARLYDALFLFDLDSKISAKKRYQDLSKISFHAKGGSMLDQSDRMKSIANKIFNHDKITEAAQMYNVGMLSNLYGDYNHLLPHLSCNLFKNKHILSNEVSFIYNIDTLVNLFNFGERVKGSRDLYGMRKMADEILDYAWSNNINLPAIVRYIEKLIDGSCYDDLLSFIISKVEHKIPNLNKAIFTSMNPMDTFSNIQDFIAQYNKLEQIETNNKNIFHVLHRLHKLSTKDIGNINTNILKSEYEQAILQNIDTPFTDMILHIENILDKCKIKTPNAELSQHRQLLINHLYKKGLEELKLTKSPI